MLVTLGVQSPSYIGAYHCLIAELISDHDDQLYANKPRMSGLDKRITVVNAMFRVNSVRLLSFVVEFVERCPFRLHLFATFD